METDDKENVAVAEPVAEPAAADLANALAASDLSEQSESDAEAPVTDENAEAEVEKVEEPAAAETPAVDDEDADPDVDTVFNKRFTKDGKLSKKEMAKTFLQLEKQANSIDPQRVRAAENAIQEIQEIAASSPEVKKAIDEYIAKKTGRVQERSWADVKREANELSRAGKADEAYELLQAHDPRRKEERALLAEVQADRHQVQVNKHLADYNAYNAEVTKETGVGITPEEQAVMLQIINSGGGKDQAGKVRTYREIHEDAVVYLDQQTARKEAFKRRSTTLAGKPAAGKTSPAPTPAGKTRSAPASGKAPADPFLAMLVRSGESMGVDVSGLKK